MYYRGGVGLAAPQVGWNASLFIVNPYDRSRHLTEARIFINPSVVGFGGTTVGQEGCLSFPGIFASVARHKRVSVQYANTTRDGIEQEYSGFMARIIQHEFDHLNGILFIDRLTDKVKKSLKPQLVSHKERIKRIRKNRKKRQKEAEARKKGRAKKRRKQRKRKKDKK